MRRWMWLALLVLLVQQSDSLKAVAKAHDIWPFGQAKAELYTNDWCVACVRTETLVKALNMPVQRVNLDYSAQADDIKKRFGEGPLPILVMGDEVIRGYEPKRTEALWKKLQSQSVMATLLAPSSL
ncbi:glutaredoxin family protein [Gallaecimonas pentaromativorans]|uniref:Glutaredoxin n=1 Tax=Gallaecimonas pentaromativorans TaxID=584787 RepID=A0A3N1P309_9GAMM|nr:glutaredoxin family protein [Gallaecimonas pentaromativorans]ROQ22459.1 glutaredoxin [Gallaecimonas pentaromativorans]